MSCDCQSESHPCILFVAYHTVERIYCIEKLNNFSPYHHIHLKTVVLELLLVSYAPREQILVFK